MQASLAHGRDCHGRSHSKPAGVVPLPRGRLGHLRGVLGFHDHLEPLGLAFHDPDAAGETRHLSSSVSAPTPPPLPFLCYWSPLNVAAFGRIKPANFLADGFGRVYAGQPHERVLLQIRKVDGR
ncbi:hypothetical protein HJG60_009396 [Phyllostomus discolor]|uniref:Uncharacterized protein n=1 Tax=Phyllostomus discolor TaxID=89673 RepID=A0A834DCG6_9CHIR|nr:hypothetical protein HJG60_009396 [Phyllostomus discolor]